MLFARLSGQAVGQARTHSRTCCCGGGSLWGENTGILGDNILRAQQCIFAKPPSTTQYATGSVVPHCSCHAMVDHHSAPDIHLEVHCILQSRKGFTDAACLMNKDLLAKCSVLQYHTLTKGCLKCLAQLSAYIWTRCNIYGRAKTKQMQACTTA